MTPISGDSMRSLINLVEHSSAKSSQDILSEATPFNWRQQLIQAGKALFNPAANRQFMLNQYANALYREWKRESQSIKQTRQAAGSAVVGGSKEATARDFLTWYAGSLSQEGKMLPASVSAVQTAMRQVGVTDLDQPLNDDQLGKVCQQISVIVQAKHAKVTTGILQSATSEEEKQVFDLFAKIDDWMLKYANTLTLFKVSQMIAHELGIDKSQMGKLNLAFKQTEQRLSPRGLLSSLPTPFGVRNITKLNDVQKTQLLQVLPTLLLLTIRNLRSQGFRPQKPAPSPVSATTSAQPTPAVADDSVDEKWKQTRDRLAQVIEPMPNSELKRTLINILNSAVNQESLKKATEALKQAITMTDNKTKSELFKSQGLAEFTSPAESQRASAPGWIAAVDQKYW
jgi:hypothetical protein